jgi:hypothetical protein
MAKQDQNDTSSNLSRISQEFRDREIARNTFQDGDPYNINHPNAKSDGDERGKGETNTIGGRTDIAKRQESIARNKFSLNNPYNIDNA